MDEKLANSSTIIEGKVIHKEAFKYGDHIYTNNHIQVIRTVKGDAMAGDILEIITSGGTLEEVSETWTYMPDLSQNQHGFFFLRPSAQSMYKEVNSSNAYEIYSGVQGIYTYSNDVSRTIYSTLESYRDVEQFYHLIGLPEYANYTSPESEEAERTTPGDTCIVYNIRPVGNTFSDTTLDGQRVIYIDLDLFIKVTAGSFRLYNANLETYYNTTMFGSNVVANGKITAVKSSYFNTNYTLTLTDEASDKIKINLLGNTFTAASLQQIDTSYKYVARFTLELIGWDGKSPLEWDELTIDNDKYSQEGTNTIMNFGCEKFKYGTCVDPNITNDTEMDDYDYAAGTGTYVYSSDPINHILTIKGENFGLGSAGNPPANARVEFKNIGKSESKWLSPHIQEYISWTPTEIKVKIPSTGFTEDGVQSDDVNAASGSVRVCIDEGAKRCNCKDESNKTINIRFAIANQYVSSENKVKVNIIQSLDNATDGGYLIYFDASMSYAAKEAFKRAMGTWRCTTKLNVSLGTGDYDSSKRGHVLVEMASIDEGTVSDVVAQVLSSNIHCEKNVYSYFNKCKIQFQNNGVNWFYGSGLPPNNEVHFESVALHELGHLFSFLHTNNSNDVMYPTVDGFFKKEDLDDDEIQGGQHMKEFSSNNTPCTYAMIPISSSECTLSNHMTSKMRDKIIIYPSVTESIINIEIDKKFQTYEYSIFNAMGERVTNFSCQSDSSIDVSSLVPGIYFLKVIEKNGYFLVVKFNKI